MASAAIPTLIVLIKPLNLRGFHEWHSRGRVGISLQNVWKDVGGITSGINVNGDFLTI